MKRPVEAPAQSFYSNPFIESFIQIVGSMPMLIILFIYFIFQLCSIIAFFLSPLHVFLSQHRLYFAVLSSGVFSDLENRFGAPVLEAYGMTEASHQMSSNLLPPGERNPGTVGTGTGVDISIMNEAGDILGYEQTGEVVIKGGNVTCLSAC